MKCCQGIIGPSGADCDGSTGSPAWGSLLLPEVVLLLQPLQCVGVVWRALLLGRMRRGERAAAAAALH